MDTLRCVNDCVYGIVDIPECARAAIGTGLVQRLRRIKQLGNLMAWPSATHTRFEHSVGTMHLAHKYAEMLRLTPRETEVFVLAALLHDVGHGPYSHTFEVAIAGTPSAALFENHDAYRLKLVVDDPALGEAVAPWVDDMVAVWTDDPARATTLPPPMVGVLHALLEGVVGIDRLDYVARDLYHTRPQMTLDRSCCQTIMRETAIDREAGTVTYSAAGKRVVEHFLLVRAYLYREVYLHRRAVAADLLLRKALVDGGERLIRQYLTSPLMFEFFDDGVIDGLAAHPDIPADAELHLKRLLRGQVPKMTPVDGPVDGGMCFGKAATANEMAHVVGLDPPDDITKWFARQTHAPKTQIVLCKTHAPENIETMQQLLADAAHATTSGSDRRCDLRAYLAVTVYDGSVPGLLRYRTPDGYTGVLDGATGEFQLVRTDAIAADTPPALRRANVALAAFQARGHPTSLPTIVDPVVWYMYRFSPRDDVRELSLFVTESGAVQANYRTPKLRSKVLITLSQVFQVIDDDDEQLAADVSALPRMVPQAVRLAVSVALADLRAAAARLFTP